MAAKNAYEHVLEDNPNHAKVLQQLGWLYHQPGTTFSSQDLAIQYLTRSLESGTCRVTRSFCSCQSGVVDILFDAGHVIAVPSPFTAIISMSYTLSSVFLSFLHSPLNWRLTNVSSLPSPVNLFIID